MPRRNGIGPLGARAMTGRKPGVCAEVNEPGYGRGLGRSLGKGLGKGCGRGLERGLGRSMGLGFGRGFGANTNYGYNQTVSKKVPPAQREQLKTALDDAWRTHNSKPKWRENTPAALVREDLEIYIDDNCVGCGLCAESCPVDAISLIGNQAVINKEICIECASCVDVCPFEAIHQED